MVPALSVPRLLLLLTMLSNCAVTTAAQEPRTFFGTLRATGPIQPPPLAYEHAQDKYAFTGSVVHEGGNRFVDHIHDVVFHPSTAFLDDFAEMLRGAVCTPASAGGSSPPSIPLLPGEAPASSRLPFVISLTIAAGVPHDAFVHRFSHAAHVVIGRQSLPVLPAECTALLGNSSSTYRVDTVHVVGNRVSLHVSPAPFLAGFASAYWRHVVKKERPPAPAPAAANATTRNLDSFLLFNDGLNWANGAVVSPLLPLGHWSYEAVNATVDCVDCYAYIEETITIELQFCAWARYDITIPRLCILWACTGPFDMGIVGVGPAGLGCNGVDQQQTGIGFHLAMTAYSELDAGFGAGVQATLDLEGGTLQTPRLTIVPEITVLSQTFFVWGLPVVMGVNLSLSANLYASGDFAGIARTGQIAVSGSLTAGFSYDPRVSSGVVPIQSSSLSASRTPPSLTLVFGASSFYVDIIPSLKLTLYGTVTLNAEFPIRTQADLGYVAADAVLCDLPYCALPALGRTNAGASLSVYLTWQALFNLTLMEVRLKALVAEVPFVGGLASNLVSSSFVLIPQQGLVFLPLNSRQLITAQCWPSIINWQGSRRALAVPTGQAGDWQGALLAAGLSARQLLAVLSNSPSEDAATLPNSTADASAIALTRAIRGGVGGRSLNSVSCGTYGGPSNSGGWSGSECSINGCNWPFGSATCASTYTLYCNAGFVSYSGYSSSCTGTSTSGFFGCNGGSWDFDNTAYCSVCPSGSYCPGGTGWGSYSCPCCPTGSGNFISCTPTMTPSATLSPTRTATASLTASASLTGTATASLTGTSQATQSITATITQTVTAGASSSTTGSGTPTPTRTSTMTQTSSTSSTTSQTPASTPSSTGTPSPSVFGSALPSCDRSVKLLAPVFSTGLQLNTNFTSALSGGAEKALVALRALASSVTTAISIGGLNVSSADQLLQLSGAAYAAVCAVVPCGAGANSSSGVNVAASLLDPQPASGGRRLANGASPSLVLNVTWGYGTFVSSAPIATASAASLSADDNATFTDALYFAHSGAGGVASALTALVTGSSSAGSAPQFNCTAPSADPGLALALGCGSGNTSVPFHFLSALGTLSQAIGGPALGPNATLIGMTPPQSIVTMGAALVFVSVNDTYAANASALWGQPQTFNNNATSTSSPLPVSGKAGDGGTAAAPPPPLLPIIVGVVVGVLAVVVILAAVACYVRHVRRRPHQATDKGLKGLAAAPPQPHSAPEATDPKSFVNPYFRTATVLARATPSQPPIVAAAPPSAQPVPSSQPVPLVQSAPSVLPAGVAVAAAVATPPAPSKTIAQAASEEPRPALQQQPGPQQAEYHPGLSMNSKRQYAKVVVAEANLAAAAASETRARVARAFRGGPMSLNDAALMLQRAWRQNKFRRTTTHFLKVAGYDKRGTQPSMRGRL